MNETLEEKIEILIDELEDVLNDMEIEADPTPYNKGYYNAIVDCIGYLNQRLHGKSRDPNLINVKFRVD